jgi:membrane-bound lytic murein transglycosylase B
MARFGKGSGDGEAREQRRYGHRVSRGAQVAATLVMVACTLASCSTPGTSNGGAGPRGTAGTPSTSSGQAGSRPATNDASALAGQLNRAAATLRAKDATTSECRHAAEFQQLAVGALVAGRAAFFRRVVTFLDPATARDIRSDVRAGRLLHAMTEPQPHLPRWRIVAPRPAAELLGFYKRAQRRTGVSWTYLAAMNLVETRMGRIRGTSTAGAQGPMQFLPSTWDRYGAGGNINDPRDAILAAARLLKRNGAPGHMGAALWHFNPSDNYVGAVREYARTMQRSASAYGGYWHWRVLYRQRSRTYILPVGYPEHRPVALPRSVRSAG